METVGDRAEQFRFTDGDFLVRQRACCTGHDDTALQRGHSLVEYLQRGVELGQRTLFAGQ